ncbi:MAG: RNA polymerase sigma factor [Candidatus Krumholzibacteria bacterium]|nr:RNA polymerase sigma factor [Candidatus Krumholzibacteria bacterium]
MFTIVPDSDPLDTLARENAAGVFRYMRSLVGDPEEARDLVQETFLRLGRHAARNGGAGAIGAGLVFTTARTCGLDHLRRREVRRRHEVPLDRDADHQFPDPSVSRPDSSLEDGQLRRDLAVALAALPEDQRTAFHFSEIEGLTYEAIAGLLQVSPGTIASRKYHAVRKLRDQLRRLGHET